MRATAGVVAGWLTMGVLVMAGFAAGPMLLGVERVFEPGTYRAATLWIVLALFIGLLGAAAGGWVAARLGRGRAPVLVLAALMVLLTVSNELRRAPATDAPPVARPPQQSVFEALQASREHAREPLVTRVTNPIAGLLGLWIGAGLALRGGRKPRRDPPRAAGTDAA
jgi:hypothetical protein